MCMVQLREREWRERRGQEIMFSLLLCHAAVFVVGVGSLGLGARCSVCHALELDRELVHGPACCGKSVWCSSPPPPPPPLSRAKVSRLACPPNPMGLRLYLIEAEWSNRDKKGRERERNKPFRPPSETE